MSFVLDSSDDDFSPLQSRGNEEDQEIENLEQQIDEMNKYLISIKSHSEDRLRRYNRTIQKLDSQINIAKTTFSSDLLSQKEKQNQEIKGIVEEHDREIEELLYGAEKMNITTENWAKISANLKDLGEKIQLNEIQKGINRTQTEGSQIEIARNAEKEANSAKRLTKIENQQRQVKLLEEEIARYLTLKRQESFEYDRMTSECNQAQENREKCHELTVNRLKQEAVQRDSIFAEHLGIVEKQLEREKVKTQKDTQILKETEDSLQSLRRTMSQRSMKQLGDAMYDIQQIEKMLNENAEKENVSMQLTSTSVSKTQSVERQNDALKQRIGIVQNQVRNIQTDISRGTAELKRAKTPQKKSSKNKRFGSLNFFD